MRMPGPQKHRHPLPGNPSQPLSEDIKRIQSPIRIDHILTGNEGRIGRNPTLVRHEGNQLPNSPPPLRIKPEGHPRIPGGEEPITPQTLLPRGRHGTGQPSGQQMGTQRSPAPHKPDADAQHTGKSPQRGNTARLA